MIRERAPRVRSVASVRKKYHFVNDVAQGGVIEDEYIEIDDHGFQCMENLKAKMLEGTDPCNWFDAPRSPSGTGHGNDLIASCEVRLRCCIARILRKKYEDLLRKYPTVERDSITTQSQIVLDLSDAFLGREEFDMSIVQTKSDCRAIEKERDAIRQKIKILSKSEALKTSADIEYEVVSMLSKHELSILLGEEEGCENRVAMVPYVGYFVYRLLIPAEKRKDLGRKHPIAYWSTREAWDKSLIEDLWKLQDEKGKNLTNRMFEAFLEKAADNFLSKINARVSPTYGISESIRKKLGAARRERGVFLRILAGEGNDPDIENIRRFLKTRQPDEKWNSANEKKRSHYDRKTTRWGNYGNPTEESRYAIDGSIYGMIRHDEECAELMIRINDKKPNGRRPNIGRKGELENYLEACFNVADGTLPMKVLVELILRKCKQLRPVSTVDGESRHTRIGHYEQGRAAALEMKSSDGSGREQW